MSQVLSSKVVEMTTGVSAHGAHQTLNGIEGLGVSARSRHWQGGLKLLQNAMPGDVLAAVARDDVLVASNRQELVLAVMEAMHDSKAANGSMRHLDWVHAIGQLTGRLAAKLLAGSGSGAVLDDALSGNTPSSIKASQGTL